jgi:hypothetical protein
MAIVSFGVICINYRGERLADHTATHIGMKIELYE